MIKTIVKIVKAIVREPPRDNPDDLKAFEVAKQRLHRSSQTLIKEADAFGRMIRDMRGETSAPQSKRRRKSGAKTGRRGK